MEIEMGSGRTGVAAGQALTLPLRDLALPQDFLRAPDPAGPHPAAARLSLSQNNLSPV
jgi:hypothetical protein